MTRLAILTLLLAATASAAPVDFAKDVFPVLKRACFDCHGPETQKAGLRLDSASSKHAEIGGDLLRRVALPKENKEAMPRRGPRLSAAEIARLRDWIESGAKWPEQLVTLKHWSYTPPHARRSLPFKPKPGPKHPSTASSSPSSKQTTSPLRQKLPPKPSSAGSRST